MTRTIQVAGVDLALEERGAGRPLLFLHPGEGLQPDRPWLDRLARDHRVIAPYHPGFGPTVLPDWFAALDENKDGQVSLFEWRAGGRAIGFVIGSAPIVNASPSWRASTGSPSSSV